MKIQHTWPISILLLANRGLLLASDPNIVVSTTNLPLSGFFTASGPYTYLVGQRFTTDSSSNQVVRGMGIYIGDFMLGDPGQGYHPTIAAGILPDDHGHPVTGYPNHPTNAVSYASGPGIYENYMLPDQMNYFGGGELDLEPNTSFWEFSLWGLYTSG